LKDDDENTILGFIFLGLVMEVIKFYGLNLVGGS